MERTSPDSTSAERLGAATITELSASTAANMKAIRIRSWEAIRRTSTTEGGWPFGPLTVQSRDIRKLVPTMTRRVSPTSAIRSLRLDASRTVSLANVKMGATSISSGVLVAEQLQEAVLQAQVTGFDRVDSAAQPHDLVHQLGDPLRLQPANGDPLAVVIQLTEGVETAPLPDVQTGHPHPA